ncbi:MAG: helix-turn-helix domain-containing protein [Burkholderiaceae bacterium]|nr:MAG: helix-turn-helix domain-containing protein [Burkholderiaceae bacterium]TAM07025.1 MAG: helix-turn-helix domain-containing protein [Pusillimonas sp.]
MTQPLLREVNSAAKLEQADAESMPDGVGATVKALRIAKQLSIADASARLKYSTRQIEALEAEQWDALPTGVPLRGLVKNYARFLETDVDALLAMLESQVGAPTTSPIVLTTESLSSADLALLSDAGPRSSWGWLVVILILLIVAGLYAIERGWVPDTWLVFDWLRSLKQ